MSDPPEARRRRPRPGERTTIGLAEVAAAGILLPGSAVQVIRGSHPAARPDRRAAVFVEARVQEIDPAGARVVVAGDGLGALSGGMKVELGFGRTDGLYLGPAVVAGVDPASAPPRAALRLNLLRRIEERREQRVALRGARATFWLPGRVCDAAVADLSPDGIGVHADLPVGSEVRLRLAVPGSDPLPLRGRVVWNDPAIGRAGIAFAAVDEGTRERVAFLCLFHRAVSDRRRARGEGPRG